MVELATTTPDVLFNPDKFANGSPEPKDLGLPFESWRPGQWEVIASCLFSPKKYLLIEAPTGVGKSGIAVALSRLSGLPTSVLTSTLQLQDQYEKLGAKTVKGRRNFPCILEDGKVTCDDGPCTLGLYCPHKEARSDDESGDNEWPKCLYYQQKAKALACDVAVHSYSYFLSESNYVGGFSRANQLLVLDEAHLIEDELRKFVSIDYPYHISSHHPTRWDEWVDYARDQHNLISHDVREARAVMKDVPSKDSLARLKRLVAQQRALFALQNIDKSWVIDKYDRRFGTTHLFRPAWVAHYTQPYLFRHATKIVMMSATILDPDMFCAMLGIDPEDVEYIPMDSPFRADRRLLVYQPAMKVTSRVEDYSPLINKIDALLSQHPNDKGLIHTTNYKVARIIMEGSRYASRLVTHQGSAERADVLDQLRYRPDPVVLVSPSMGTGVDLPDELCRFQIIAKLPFPDRGDRQVQRRLEVGPDGEDDPTAGNRWYNWSTACSLVQMYGRAMRSEDDYGITYIVDGSWGWWYQQNKRLLPDWVKAALVT